MPYPATSVPVSISFNEAVALARKEYPQETKNITFVNASVRGWKSTVHNWYKKHAPANIKNTLPVIFETRNKTHLRKAFTLFIKNKKSSFAVKDNPNNNALIFSKDNDLISNKIQSFYHELGHLVARNGYPELLDPTSTSWQKIDNSSLSCEIVADTFEVLHGLKKGFCDKAYIDELSLNRSLGFVFTGHCTHLTSLSLDLLLQDKKLNDVKSLTPEKIKSLAEKYGEENPITEKDIQNLGYTHIKGFGIYISRDTPKDVEMGQRLALFAEWAHEYQAEDSVTYYIADKILRHVIKQNGDITYPCTMKIDISGPDWDKIRRRIDSRAPATPANVNKQRTSSTPAARPSP